MVEFCSHGQLNVGIGFLTCMQVTSVNCMLWARQRKKSVLTKNGESALKAKFEVNSECCLQLLLSGINIYVEATR